MVPQETHSAVGLLPWRHAAAGDHHRGLTPLPGHPNPDTRTRKRRPRPPQTRRPKKGTPKMNGDPRGADGSCAPPLFREGGRGGEGTPSGASPSRTLPSTAVMGKREDGEAGPSVELAGATVAGAEQAPGRGRRGTGRTGEGLLPRSPIPPLRAMRRRHPPQPLPPPPPSVVSHAPRVATVYGGRTVGVALPHAAAPAAAAAPATTAAAAPRTRRRWRTARAARSGGPPQSWRERWGGEVGLGERGWPGRPPPQGAGGVRGREAGEAPQRALFAAGPCERPWGNRSSPTGAPSPAAATATRSAP